MGAEAPSFAVLRESPERGNSESPLWRLFWGVWGSGLFYAEKTTPQVRPVGQRKKLAQKKDASASFFFFTKGIP